MKKEQIYKFSNLGYVKMLWDLKQEKISKINSVVSICVILSMFSLGLLSKELLIVMLTNMGLGKVTSWLIG